jgi:hypothetical protein
MKNNPGNLVKNPTFKNLTDYAVENAAKLIAEAGRIPTVFWCVGERTIITVEFPDSNDKSVVENTFGYCAQVCIAESAKATILLLDSAVTGNGTPNQTATMVVDLPGLQVCYIYSIVQDKAGKPKLGNLFFASEVMRVNQREAQAIPVGTPSPAERLQASIAAFSDLEPCSSAN